MVSDEFRRQVRDALEHLYEPAYLEVHALLRQLAGISGPDSLTRAQRLRGLLKEAIEALRPERDSTSGSPTWRSYLALRYRYVQGMSMGETADELGLSLRQVQRELRHGLDALSAILWERHATGNRAEAALPGQEDELRQELDQWRLALEPHEVQRLADDTLSTLRPLLEQRRATVQVDLPPTLAPVVADSTLTRQTLSQILRLMAQGAGPGPISLRARQTGDRVEIVLSRRSTSLDPHEEGWQTAQLLAAQQGGALSAEALPDGGARVVLSLPQAGHTRVLVIDDNQAIHQLFERYLAPHRYQALHAEAGDEALRLAVEEQPDLITLDVMMPNVDGWRVLRELGQNPITAHIPIVVCSVLKEPELAFALGACAYLKKPVDRLELLATLARLRPPAGPAAGASPPGPSGR